MSNKDTYIERALIKLKRQYGKDELVATLLKQISDQEVELGKLKAEIEFLQDELQNDKQSQELNRSAKIEARKEELYRLKVEDNLRLRKEIKKLRMVRNDLISENLVLKRQGLVLDVR